MFCINDMEDIAIARNLSEAATLRQETREMTEEVAFAKRMTVALKTKNSQIDQMSQQLNEIAHARNEGQCATASAARALNDACVEIARLTGQPLEQVRQRYARENRTRRYNQVVAEYIDKGWLIKDPRTSGEHAEREWYIAGL